MSSHHIVREDQEPALLICDPGFNSELLYQLLEWSPKVIVLEPALAVLLELGIKIDVLVFDEACHDLINDALHYQAPIDLVPVKDQNLISRAFNWITQAKFSGVHLLGCEGNMEKVPHLQGIDIVMYENEIKWIYCTGNFKKWVIGGQRFYLKTKHLNNIDIFPTRIQVSDQQEFIVPNDGFVELKGTNSFWLGEFIG